MTDYKSLKLIASSSPHIRTNEDTRSIMLDVIIALMPALVMGVYVFGWRALTVTLVSVASCVVWEWLYRKVMKKSSSIGDLSAVVTGIILAMNVPVGMPLGQLIVGDLVAIVVVKQLFGGIGKNFVNPALAGRAFLLGSYACVMTFWIDPARNKAPLMGSTVDVITHATPLSYMKNGDMAGLKEAYSLADVFLGKVGGSLGEISALLLIIGGVYLIVRKVINWHTPVAYIVTVAVLSLLFPKAGSGVAWMLYSIFGGGLMLGAFFMATDYATSPVTKKGQLIFGIGCGLLTSFIRLFGSLPEGVSFSIILMNILVPHIEHLTTPKPFGTVKEKKKKGAEKA